MNVNEILTKALTDLANLKDILESQLAASAEATAKRDRACLNLGARQIQVDNEIRQNAETSGEKKPTEVAIGNQVAIAVLKDRQEILELEMECRKALNQLELTRFAIEIKRLEIKTHLPHAQQIVNLTSPVA